WRSVSQVLQTFTFCSQGNLEVNEDWFNLNHLALVSTTLLPRVGPLRKRSVLGESIQGWTRGEELKVHCKMRMVVSEEAGSMGNPSGNKHLISMSPLFSD
ncbi:hypothetical protein LEMLEM_LOCUS19832, partial [Lemmus lemmus]